MSLTITLDSLSFNTGTPDANGALWYITGMEGWDSPNLRQVTSDPTSRHGAVILESMLGTRVVTLSGVCKAVSESGMWAAYNGLAGTVNNLVASTWLTVAETTPKRLAVVRGGPLRIVFQGSSFTFEIPLIAMDPLKYTVTSDSVVIAAGANTTVSVEGTFTTYPTFTSSGAGVLNVRNGSSTRVSTAPTSMASGTILNMANRTLYTGATNHYNKITPASVWWLLQPGNNTIYNDGAASTTMVYREAWI